MRQGNSERHEASLLRGVLRSVTRFSARRPKSTLLAVLLVVAATVGLTACRMNFKTERADLIDPNAAFHQRWINYTESFGDGSDLVVVVEAERPETIKQVLEELGSRMKREPELFTNVLYKVEPGRLSEKGLFYLNPGQLQAGLERLAEYGPILQQGRWDLIGLESLFTRLHYQLESRSAAAPQESLRPLLQQGELLATSLAAFLDDPGDFRSPWPEVLTVDPRLRDEAQRVIYTLNDRGNMGFLKALPARTPGDFTGASRSIDRLRQMIGELAAEYPDVKIGVTGIPVLESDEMRRSQTDMLIASIISFFGVGLVLFIGFRGFRHPALALIMLAVGMAWAFGYTTLTVGHLNILSVSFAVILIGLGIDFAIHYLARYLQLRHQGHLLRPALLETSGTVGVGIVTAAVTTALAFFCATFTQFLGVAELGIIAGGGIVLCAVATFIVLPPLVTLADQHIEPKQLPTPFEGNLLRRATARRPLLVLLGSLAVLALVGSQVVEQTDGGFRPRIGYDYNLLNLQADGLESVELQRQIFQNGNDSLLFAVSLADTPEEARALRTKFEALPSVNHVEELASRLPAYAPNETKLLVQAFRAQLGRLPNRPPQPAPANPASVGRAIEKFYMHVRWNRDPAAVSAARAIDEFLNRFEKMSVRQQTAVLNEYQFRMSAALWGQFQALAAASNPRPVSLGDLPTELTSRFVSPKGKWLVQIYPREQIWDVEPLRRFVNDVRSVDPEVTGTPLQNYEASRQILESYGNAALYALAVICLVLLVDFIAREHKLTVLLPPLAVVIFMAMAMKTQRMPLNLVLLATTYVGLAAAIAALLDFRNLRDAALAMVPPVGGGLLMFGLLGLFGIDLNPANLIVLPLVLGIGVDDGVHVIHDFRLQQGRYRTSPSTMNAIMLTSLTSMIGFGSMLVASHRGLTSVGLVLVIGVGSCLFVSLVTLPAILTLLTRQRPADAGDEAELERLTAPQHQSSRQQHGSSKEHRQQGKNRAA